VAGKLSARHGDQKCNAAQIQSCSSVSRLQGVLNVGKKNN